MSVSKQILEAYPNDVISVKVDKNVIFYGENATEVVAFLKDGRTVAGTFTTEQKASFGSIEFATQKNIPALMIAKIRSVLEGTYARE